MGITKAEVTAAPSTPPATSPDVNPVKVATGSRNTAWGANLLNRTLGTLSDVGRSKDIETARAENINLTIDALAAFAPKDPIEGMIAAQALALHHASLECLRRAMIPEQPAEIAAKLRKDGANLGRGFTDMLDALARHRGKGPQVIRVEKMLVSDGGQAVVGNVTAGRTGGE